MSHSSAVSQRRKRFVKIGLKWPTPVTLTVRYSNYSTRLPVEVQDEIASDVVNVRKFISSIYVTAIPLSIRGCVSIVNMLT